MMSSSKKQQTNITPEKLQNIALYYLGRYEASEKSLRDVLLRRIAKAKKLGLETIAAENALNNIIKKMKEHGYLDDKRYALNKARELFLKGKAKKNIMQNLVYKGIDSDIRDEVLSFLDEENNNKTDISAGINYAKRKKIGPFRQKMLENTIKKELGKMARAGFDYEIAKKIIFAKTEEELLQIKES